MKKLVFLSILICISCTKYSEPTLKDYKRLTCLEIENKRKRLGKSYDLDMCWR